MEASQWLIWLAGAGLALVVGWLLGHARAQRALTRLREDNARLAGRMEAQQAAFEEKARTLNEVGSQFEATFKSLAGDVLKSSNREFLRLAETRFKTLHTRASGELEKREKAVENLVKPIRETLEKTDQHIRKNGPGTQ